MKFFLLLAVSSFISFSFTNQDHFSKKNLLNISDSGIIKHAIDGSTSEWPANKFEKEKGINIKYAVDNDSKNLYIAMIIPDDRTQIKIMGQGMSFFIDLKGKKKDTKGIMFPINKSGGNFFTKPNESDNEKQKPDIKIIRRIMGINLLSLKLFGFSGEEAQEQDLMVPGSVNIQFSWDDKDIMYVEYGIPLSLFGDNPSLNQKTISLGYKLNDMAIQTRSVSYTRTEIRSVPAGSLPPSNTRSGSSGIGNSSPSQQYTEQSFWTKYTISIPSK